MAASDFERLISGSDDYELCTYTCDAIENALPPNAVFADFAEPCRTILLVWYSYGVIGNGGFQFLFEHTGDGDTGFVLHAAAYQRVGAKQCYQAFCEALACFPKNAPPRNARRRLRIYEQSPEETREKIDGRFHRHSDRIPHLLASYIREHEHEIREFIAVP
jgi:hypothetical protein